MECGGKQISTYTNMCVCVCEGGGVGGGGWGEVWDVWDECAHK